MLNPAQQNVYGIVWYILKLELLLEGCDSRAERLYRRIGVFEAAGEECFQRVLCRLPQCLFQRQSSADEVSRGTPWEARQRKNSSMQVSVVKERGLPSMVAAPIVAHAIVSV